MTRKVRAERLFMTSGVNVTGGQVLISVNGRVHHADADDAISVRVVSDGPDVYIEITDKHRRTRRVDCGE
jgi:hypothetical protein